MRLVVVAGTLVMLWMPAVAEAATASSVSMYSDPGDWVGGGQQRVFASSSGSTIRLTGTPARLGVDVNGGSGPNGYALVFGAPYGEALQPGVYEQNAGLPDQPYIDITGNARACNRATGRFEVKDISVDDTGDVSRLWLIYEQHCGREVPALFGEVRVNEPGLDGGGTTDPSLVRWPAADLGRVGTAVPVTLVASSTLTIASTSLSGPDASSFLVRLDDCSGRTLNPGDRCEVWVRFTPSAAGTRYGRLDIRDADGNVHASDLQGYIYGGRTRVILDSDPGAWVGEGYDPSWTPANSDIAAWGSPDHVTFSVDDAWWAADFVAPDGLTLDPGSYGDGTDHPFETDGGGMYVRGGGHGCYWVTGRFTVNEATFNPNGTLRSFGADFEQHCEGEEPALRGTFEYRIGNTVPLAPWMASDAGYSGEVVSLPPDSSPTDTAGTGETSTDQSAAAPRSEPATSPESSPTQTSASSEPLAAPALSAPPVMRPVACGRLQTAQLTPLRGTAGVDRILGTSRAELIVSGAGDDNIAGRGGDDCIHAGSGNDSIDGGAGADWLDGGSGRDILRGGAGRDMLDCGPGRDTAYVTRGDRWQSCERVVRVDSRGKSNG